MKKLLFLNLFLCLSCLAQNVDMNSRLKVVATVVEGYNTQNYKMMKKPWFWLGKIIVSKKILKREFLPFYKKYGAATIDTITYSSKYGLLAKLKMEKNNSERIYLQFMLNEKGKLEGFGFGYPPMIYKKNKGHAIPDTRTFTTRVDSLLKQKYLVSKSKPFNGSVLVLDEGQAMYQKHFGYADFAVKNELNDSTLFELASCSKQFTAFAILILEKQGKLKLSDSIQKFIPDYPYKNITVENLLTHTSGLPDYLALLEKKWDKSKFATNYDVIDQFKKYRPKVHFSPGERFEYSNSGFQALSVIIEKTSGLTYNEFLDQNIFKPLHMTRTRVYNTRRVKNEKITNYAYGYIYSTEKKKYVLPDSLKKFEEVIYTDAITGDGTVNSCTKDLMLWERELLQPKLIDKIALDRAFTNYKLKNGKTINYGYGFFLNGGIGTERLVYHTGGWPGYVCIIMHFPDIKRAVVVLSNNSYDNFTRLSDDIAAILVEE